MYVEVTLACACIKLAYPQFCQVFSPQTSHKCPCSHPLHIRDSNHSPTDEFAIAMALGPQLLIQTGLHCQKLGPYKMRRLLSMFKHRRSKTACPVPTNKVKPRHSHAVCTLQVHPPTSRCPALSAPAEPMYLQRT